MKKVLTPFEQALLEQTRLSFADVPAEDEIEYSFSENFEARMQHLVKGTDRPRRIGGNALRLLIAAIIVSLLAGCTMAAPKLIEYITHNNGQRYYFTVSSEAAAGAPERLETVYAVGDVPEGFEIYHETICTGYAIYHYTSSDGNWFSFLQEIVTQYPGNHLGGEPDSEYSTMTRENIGGYDVTQIIHDDGQMTFLWTDDEYFFSMHFKGDFTLDKAHDILRSIKADPIRTAELNIEK